MSGLARLARGEPVRRTTSPTRSSITALTLKRTRRSFHGCRIAFFPTDEEVHRVFAKVLQKYCSRFCGRVDSRFSRKPGCIWRRISHGRRAVA
eukprot:scaffold12127_cov129-Isochrysis_galbana.AAC.2